MLARKSFIQFLSGLLLTLAGIASTVLVARVFGPVVVGTIGYMTGVAGLFLLAADLGVNNAHTKRVSEGQDLGVASGTFLVLKGSLVALCALALLAFIVVARVLGLELWHDPTLRTTFLLVAAALFLSDIAGSLNLTAQARQEVARYNAPALLGRVSKLAALLIAAVVTRSAVGVGAAMLVEALVVLSLVLLLIRAYPLHRPTQAMITSYWRYALPFVAMTPLSLLGEHLDKVLLKSLAGIEQVGYYVAVQGLVTSVPLLLSKPAMSVFFPFVSAQADDPHRLRATTDLLVRILSVLTLPIVVLLFTYRVAILDLVLGPAFRPAAAVLAVASLTIYVITVVRVYLNLLYGTEHHRRFPLIAAALLPVTVLGYLFLVPASVGGLRGAALGGAGIALTTLGVWVLDGIIKIGLVQRTLRIPFYWRLVRHLAAALVMAGVLSIGRAIVGPSLLNPFIVVALVAYAGSLWVFGELRAADLVIVRGAISPRAVLRDVIDEVRPGRRP